LRGRERVDAVVMIGHQHAEADYELARAVPGIDLIFGSHSHLLRELTRIPGTATWFISPSQYLSYISRVELTFRDGVLGSVEGRLIAVDAGLPEDRRVARRVRNMQAALEADPAQRELFQPIGSLDAPLTTARLAGQTLRVMREATNADAALSTMSSFRRPLPAGKLTMELLRGAMPYDNEVVVCTMSGSQLQRVLDSSASRRGSDSESYVSAPASIDPDRQYRVATTDYQANVAYKDVFDCEKQNTGLRVRELVKESF
jgi:5'-nucleotidase